jgi:hypothetical protein
MLPPLRLMMQHLSEVRVVMMFMLSRAAASQSVFLFWIAALMMAMGSLS